MTNAPIVFAPDSYLWRHGYNGAERLPSGAEPKFAAVTIGGLEGEFIAILTGNLAGRGGISLAIEGIPEGDEVEVSGALWLGDQVTEAGAAILARAILAGSPSIEALRAIGFEFFSLP